MEIPDCTGTNKTCYHKSETDFEKKIFAVTTNRKSWQYLNKNTLLEVSNVQHLYFDKVKDKQWMRNTIDSIYFGKDIGVQQMKLYFVEDKLTINFKLKQTIISPNRPQKVDCPTK